MKAAVLGVCVLFFVLAMTSARPSRRGYMRRGRPQAVGGFPRRQVNRQNQLSPPRDRPDGRRHMPPCLIKTESGVVIIDMSENCPENRNCSAEPHHNMSRGGQTFFIHFCEKSDDDDLPDCNENEADTQESQEDEDDVNKENGQSSEESDEDSNEDTGKRRGGRFGGRFKQWRRRQMKQGNTRGNTGAVKPRRRCKPRVSTTTVAPETENVTEVLEEIVDL